MCHRAGARKQQQELPEESGPAIASAPVTATALADQDQRKALKFGFSSKTSTSKVCNYRINAYKFV